MTDTLSKNFMWMAAANIVTGVFGVVSFIYLARVLMPEAFGYLAYAQAFALYLLNFVDLGLSTYGVREVAKDRARVTEYLSDIASFRLWVAAFIYILFVAVAFFSTRSLLMNVLLAESFLLLFVSALATEWAFQGIEKMRMVFVSFAVTAMLQLGLILALVKGPGDLLKVPLIYVIGAVPVIAVFLRRLNFKLRLRSLDLKKIRLYLSSSFVIWAISIFAQVYNGLDIILLGLYRNATEVAYFSIARKVVGGVTFLMIFLANAVLPRLSCTYNVDTLQFNEAMKKFLKLAAILTIILFLPIIVFSKGLLSVTVGPEYIPAVLPLNIMILGLILVLFNLPFSTALIAACFERAVLKQAAACALLSVAANLILMPKYGMIGASITFLIVEAIALAWILIVYHRRITRLTA